MFFLLFACFAPHPALADNEFAWQRPGGKDAAKSGERKYFYNYPHQVPPDYVYRTGRVWAPGPLFPGRQGEAAGKDAGKGKASINRGARLAGAVRGLADQLVSGGRDYLVDDYVVAVASFVNLNDLYSSSSLGRYLGEELIGDLHRAGVGVVDVRKTAGFLIRRQGGEYDLSRDLDELNPVQGAQAVVVGTYTHDERQVMINARLLRNTDNLVISTASMVLDIDGLVSSMLADEKKASLRRQKESGLVRVRQVRAEETGR